MIIFIKITGLVTLALAFSVLGILLSSKYKNRVKDLKELKKAINIFETKIKFTYEPVPEIFNQISKTSNENIGNVFKVASIKMKKNNNATIAWNEALEQVYTNMNKEDIEVAKELGKMLGKTSIEGQLNQIELVKNFLDEQIRKSETECNKNEKLYKTLRNNFRYGSSYYTYINKGGINGYKLTF